MKTVFLIIIGLLLAGCSRVHDLRVIDIYQEEVDANDGCVQKEWRTTVELENGCRTIMHGKFAVTNGEQFKLVWNPANGWEAGQ